MIVELNDTTQLQAVSQHHL